MNRAHLRGLAVAVGVYVITVLALHPFADVFYGADDWAYGWSVRLLVEQHKLRVSAWAAAAAITQTFWGAAFAWVFGVHPGVMNVATLVASTVGVGLLYFVGVTLGLTGWLAALAALVVVVDPLYLGFAASFMTDSYYAVLLLGSCVAWLRALRSGSLRAAAVGGVLASLALLNRQIGLVLPPSLVAGALASWLLRRLNWKQALIVSAVGATPPVLVLYAYRRFPDLFGGISAAQRLKMPPEKVWERLMDFWKTLDHAHLTLIYVGVFTAPLVVVLLSGRRSREILWSKAWGIPASLLVLVSIAAYRMRLQDGENLLVSGEFFQTSSFGAPPLAYMEPCWEILAFVGSVAFPILVVLVLQRLVAVVLAAIRKARGDENVTPEDRGPELVFLSVAFVGHLILVASFLVFYNNYFLPLIILGAALAMAVHGGDRASEPRRPLLLGGVFAGLTAVASVVVLDYHYRYVEADARLANRLVAAGTDSGRIYGYASWYAWRHYDVVEKEIEKKAWGPLERIRNRVPTLILTPVQKPKRRRFKLVRSEEYRTILGKGRLDLWQDPRVRRDVTPP
jgi:hypothetical protein